MSSKLIVKCPCSCSAIQRAMTQIMPQAALIVKALDIAKNSEIKYETFSWPSLHFCLKSFNISSIIVS